MTQDQIQFGLFILQLITTVAAIIAIVQTHIANKRATDAEESARQSQIKSDEAKRVANGIEAELRRRQEDFDASEQYGKVKELIRPFEKSASRLGVLLNDEEATDREKRIAFMDAYNEYTDLYNEINSFCAHVNNGTVVAENYMKNAVIPILKRKAETQADYQETFMYAAKKLKMPNIHKPDYGAFSEYNKFLEKRLIDSERNRIMEKRKKAGL